MNGSNDSFASFVGNGTCTRPTVDYPGIIMVAIFGLICVIGLVGNGLVIFVILRYTKMKTVTNMYILNLSIADTLFLLGLPLIMTTVILKQWIFGYAMCKIFYILTCINTFTGAFTLTVMSGDRYFAVCFPITSMKYRTSKYASLAIAMTWLVSLLLMIPIFLYATKLESSPGRYSCSIQWPSMGIISPEKAFIYYTMLIGFVVPVLLISILYTLLVVRLRTTGPQVKSAEKRRSHRKVTKLVTMIIVVYIFCWLPYWAFQLHLINSPAGRPMPKWKLIIYQCFTVLSYANSMVNPCLYAFTNENFRESFINAFRCAADPILSGRRCSEMGSTIGNNNMCGKKKVRSEVHAEYEFTTLATTMDGNGN
nr:allatostatin-C receptor 1 [Platynereis dumerilii]